MIRSASAISKTCLITGRMIKMAPVRFVFRWWLAAAYSRLAKHGRSSVMVWQGPKWNHVVGLICQALPMRAQGDAETDLCGVKGGLESCADTAIG